MMTRLDAYTAFLGTKPISADDLSTIFQLGNDHLYTQDAQQMLFAYALTGKVLRSLGFSAASGFNENALTDETTMNVHINSKGGFFSIAFNPIKGTNKIDLCILIGNLNMDKTTIQNLDEKKVYDGGITPYFVMTGTIMDEEHLLPGETLMLTEENGKQNHIKESALGKFKHHICYADEAFTAVISDDVALAGGCQYWLTPDATVDEQYDYISQRSAEDLAKEIMEIEAEMDIEKTPFPVPALLQ